MHAISIYKLQRTCSRSCNSFNWLTAYNHDNNNVSLPAILFLLILEVPNSYYLCKLAASCLPPLCLHKVMMSLADDVCSQVSGMCPLYVQIPTGYGKQAYLLLSVVPSRVQYSTLRGSTASLVGWPSTHIQFMVLHHHMCGLAIFTLCQCWLNSE